MATYKTQWGDVIPLRECDEDIELDYGTFDLAAEISKETSRWKSERGDEEYKMYELERAAR